METLTIERAQGVYELKTVTSKYLLDFNRNILARFPQRDMVAEDYPVALLRKDREPIPFTLLRDVQVGAPAAFRLQIRDDGVPTLRTTTPVTEIRAL